MARHILRAFVILLVGLMVVSCAAMKHYYRDERLPLYDVRDVAVLSSRPVSYALIQGVDTRVSDAIAATVRRQALPRVVLSVKIDRVIKGAGERRDRNEAEFSVDVASVDSGALIASGSFKAVSYSMTVQTADENLAEDIAARIRYAFGLTTPSILKVRRPPVLPPIASADSTDYQLPAVTTGLGLNTDDGVEPVAKVERKPKPVDTQPASSDLESGAKGAITIKPVVSGDGAAAGATQPCVATAGTTCATAQ